MKYLLDTNVLIAMFKGNTNIRKAIMNATPEECVVSELTIGELLVGAYKSKSKKHIEQVLYAKRKFKCLPVTPEIIDNYALNRANLELSGNKLDTLDLLIGSTAIVNDISIVTHNTKHFERIPNVNVEDWE